MRAESGYGNIAEAARHGGMAAAAAFRDAGNPVMPPGVEVQIDRACSATASLARVIDMLSDRLGPVMRGAGLPKDGCNIVRACTDSPLAGRIADQADRVVILDAIIGDLLHRLDLP